MRSNNVTLNDKTNSFRPKFSRQQDGSDVLFLQQVFRCALRQELTALFSHEDLRIADVCSHSSSYRGFRSVHQLREDPAASPEPWPLRHAAALRLKARRAYGSPDGQD